MYKLAIAALLATSVAAFAPAQTGKASTALNAAAEYESYPGVLEPVGFFDPLGLADKADPALFKKYREAELTHGRVGKFSPIACFGTHSTHLRAKVWPNVAIWACGYRKLFPRDSVRIIVRISAIWAAPPATTSIALVQFEASTSLFLSSDLICADNIYIT